MDNLVNLGHSLEAMVAKDQLKDLAVELADKNLEKIFEASGELPGLAFFYKTMKAIKGINDAFFMEKCVTFLTEIKEVPTEARKAMVDKINEDSTFNQKFGKFSLIAIDRFEEQTKAKLLGQAAKYLANDQIDFVFYMRFSFIVSRLYIDDIKAFANDEFLYQERLNLSDFESLGLIQITSKVKANPTAQRFRLNSSNSQPSASDFVTAIKKEMTLWGCVFKNIVLNRALNLGYWDSLENVIKELKQSTQKRER